MAEYISREAAKKAHCQICFENSICYRNPETCQELKAFDRIPAAFEDAQIGIIPAADVQPVRHGRWIEGRETADVCSECNAVGWRDFRYCHNCGAKMDGGDT